MEFRREPAGGGPLRLFADEVLIAETTLDIDLPFRWQIGGAGLRIAHDAGLPVTDDYEPPFAFDGEVHGVEIQSHALAPPAPDDTHLHRLLRHE